MKRIMIACVAVAAFAAPAFADPPTTPPTGGVAGTAKASPLATERSFDPVNGASIFGGRQQGEFGAAQADFVGQINGGTTEFDNYGAFLRDWCGGSNCGAPK